MTDRPGYFEPIRLRAAQRWNQLEGDPELAGPWHQLFKQVQSPRHVLSELLQNADDAGATEAQVRIDDCAFVFEHNGEDFIEEHFASLCRFGFSNKRALHTIGFRGIGFKSTFSLGDRVELYTPTISVDFYRDRFTEPRWSDLGLRVDGKTCVRVAISDPYRQRELEKNLEDWLKSPVSLLFFKHVRKMQIGDRSVHWSSAGSGPVPDSEWMTLGEETGEKFLLVRSEAEAFPDEALAEIRQERMLAADDDSEFPPCRIEIVTGTPGQLFVVLPTGVETALPFACNAPFIQDPARLKIKDPETSPTNRWLLERAGELAASAMLSWLNRRDYSASERSAAYRFFTDVDQRDHSLRGVCGATVENAFYAEVAEESFLLTNDGELTPAKGSVILPEAIFNIWPEKQAAALLDDQGRPPLCRDVSAANRKTLVNWEVVDQVDKKAVLAVLQNKHLPKPESWKNLLNLWAYVAPEIAGYRRQVSAEDLRIVPVQGRDVLYAGKEVVRLGEKKLLQSDADWEFLAAHLVVLNRNWTRFLAEQRRETEGQTGGRLLDAVKAAYAVLGRVGLSDTSDVGKVIERVAESFFAPGKVSIANCIQLAQIAAKLGAKVGDAFRYVARDRHLKSVSGHLLFDEDGGLEPLLPEANRESHLLYPDYLSSFSSCTWEEWLGWVTSGRSALLTFVPLSQEKKNIYSRERLDELVRDRGYDGDLQFHYVTSQFILDDWDFDAGLWNHWEGLAEEDDRVWGRVASRIFAQRDTYWKQSRAARALHVATTGNTRSMTTSRLLPAWVLRLRELPCLPDTRGFLHKPGDLLRRTHETESLIDVEPFVDSRFDHESTRPLLDLLGVRSTPTGADRLLDCLRALSKAPNPPAHEVEKWYVRLDQMVETCATEDLQNIKQAFLAEKLILTEGGDWTATAGVFLGADDDEVPGAAVIRSSVRDLMLWRKIDVAERPTADLAIEWLGELPSSRVLPQDDARRVRALLMRYPRRIWEESGHWLNLAGEWTETGGLSYGLTMQSLIPWKHLHEWVKQQTADLQRVPAQVTDSPPFSELPTLAAHVEDRFHHNPIGGAFSEQRAWITAFGSDIRRIELDDETETSRVRSLAEDLFQTTWQPAPGLEIIPYIAGTPAGTPRRTDVLWLDQVLYVDELSKAKLAKKVPEEIAKAFARQDIKAALDYSFERAPDDIRDYLEENFQLAPAAKTPTSQKETHEDGLAADVTEAAPEIQPEGRNREPAEPEQNTGSIPSTEDIDVAIPDDKDLEDRALDDIAADALPDTQDNETPPGPPGPMSPPPPPAPPKPSIIERFARTQGYKKDAADRFFHPNGDWICRSNGARSLWEHHKASGDLVRYYWPKDHCLERDALQLGADVWGLMDQHPDTYALILTNSAGEPIEVTGKQLHAMRDAGDIKLYPATYRLVYGHAK